MAVPGPAPTQTRVLARDCRTDAVASRLAAIAVALACGLAGPAPAETVSPVSGMGLTAPILDPTTFRPDTTPPLDQTRGFLGLPLFQQRLSIEQRGASLAPDLRDAVTRIEGIHDPTRVGVFGPALHMEVRPGTASLGNIFGDLWHLADADPNIHYQTRYLATVWMFSGARACTRLRRFRPDESLIVFDQPTPADCARFEATKPGQTTRILVIATAPLSLPLFASPYAGGRLSIEDLHAAQEAHAAAIRERLKLKWLGAQLRNAATELSR